MLKSQELAYYKAIWLVWTRPWLDKGLWLVDFWPHGLMASQWSSVRYSKKRSATAMLKRPIMVPIMVLTILAMKKKWLLAYKKLYSCMDGCSQSYNCTIVHAFTLVFLMRINAWMFAHSDTIVHAFTLAFFYAYQCMDVCSQSYNCTIVHAFTLAFFMRINSWMFAHSPGSWSHGFQWSNSWKTLNGNKRNNSFTMLFLTGSFSRHHLPSACLISNIFTLLCVCMGAPEDAFITLINLSTKSSANIILIQLSASA